MIKKENLENVMSIIAVNIIRIIWIKYIYEVGFLFGPMI